MESALDAIASGQRSWEQYLIQWNQVSFQPALQIAYQQLGISPSVPRSSESYPLSEYPCPICSEPLEEYSYTKAGVSKRLLRCSHPTHRRHQCKEVAFFWTQQQQWWSQQFGTLGDAAPLESSDQTCPLCQQPLVKVPSQKVEIGYFLKCSSCADVVLFYRDRTEQWERPKPKTAPPTEKKRSASSPKPKPKKVNP